MECLALYGAALITQLSLQGFRNLQETTVEFSPGLTVVCGGNGQGKTNLLEAIHLLCQGFSFRTRNLSEAIGWNVDSLVIRGSESRGGVLHTRALQVHRRQGIKAKLDGNEGVSAGLLFGDAPVVMMGPSDIALVREGPDERRRYLDELLCYRHKGNADLLRRYKRVLLQRNRWLKEQRERVATGGEELFAVLTEQLVALGARLTEERSALCAELAPGIAHYHGLLSDGADQVRALYHRSGGQGENAETISASYAERLRSQASAERRLGTTLSGPHRDDLLLEIAGHPLRVAGSQGQCRCAALALRLAAVDLTLAHSGFPILLLDDIFAELDPKRRAAVAEVIRSKGCQTFVAAPHAADLPFAGDTMIEVRGGSLAVVNC